MVDVMRTAAAPARRISAAEAAGLVRSGMWLDFGLSVSQPDGFDAAKGTEVRTSGACSSTWSDTARKSPGTSSSMRVVSSIVEALSASSNRDRVTSCWNVRCTGCELPS